MCDSHIVDILSEPWYTELVPREARLFYRDGLNFSVRAKDVE